MKGKRNILQILAEEFYALYQRGKDVWGLVPFKAKTTLGLATLIMALTSVSGTAVTLLIGQLLDRVQNERQIAPWDIYLTALLFLGVISLIYVVREALHVVRRNMVEGVCTRISCDMQSGLMSHMLMTDLCGRASEKIGAQQGKMVRSVDGLVRFIRIMFLDCLPAIFTGLFAITAAVTKQPLLGAVMLGVMPVSVWITIRQLSSQKHVRLQLMRDCEEIDGTVAEQLAGAEYIRAANTHWLETQRLTAATEKRRTRELHHHFQMSLFGCGKALNEGLFHVLVIGMSIYLAIQGHASLGDVLVFSVLYLGVMAPLNELHRILDEGHEASLRVGDLLEILHEPLDRSYEVAMHEPFMFEQGRPLIEISNLVVDYVSTDGTTRRALNDVSLSINHGECIGVAGRSGSGKSTWIKVLLRLLHPSSGHVRLGGVPLEKVGRADIARLIGYVSQNPFVFSGSIAENICYGVEQDTDSREMVYAAEAANLHEAIIERSGSYSAEVSERGLNLSGGERQRLAIARVLLKKSPILVLDEATSALDNISERKIQQSLGLTTQDRTTILIAHRLSTLRDCDRILIFDEGRIVEMGTYDELLQLNGVFAELLQSANKTSSPSATKPTLACVK